MTGATPLLPGETPTDCAPQGTDSPGPATSGSSSQRFTRPQRLLNAAAFDAVYALRLRVVDDCFAVNAAPNQLGHARLGLSIGGKAVGNSVARNRVKRVVRESFRLAAGGLGSLDLVVGARNGARTAHNAQLRQSLDGLWKKIQKRCVVS